MNAQNKSAPDVETSAFDDDASFLAEVALGDREAFEKLYVRHVEIVLRTATRICRSNAMAEDIAQIAFCSLWEHASDLADRRVSVRAWLRTVARNAAIDALRLRSAADVSLDDTAEPAVENDAERNLIANEASAVLHRALEALPENQRKTVEMVYFQERTQREAADEMHVPLGTIKSRLRLAFASLRRVMGPAAADER